MPTEPSQQKAPRGSREPLAPLDKFIIALKIITLAVVFAWVFSQTWNMTAHKLSYFLDSGRIFHAAIYLAVVILAWLGLLITPFIRPWWVRCTLIVFFLAGYVFDEIMIAVSNRPLTIELAATLLENIGLAPSVTSAYLPLALKALVLPLIACAILCLPAKRPITIPVWSAVLPIGMVALISTIVHLTRGGATEFVSPYAVPAKFVTASALGLYSGERSAVTYSKPLTPKIRNIVLIVDESVRADSLEFNGAPFANTPYLVANSGRIANFGIASAAWNCSKESRLILRTGLREDQLPDIKEVSLRQPSIWQFAKHAGYEPIQIDGWGEPDRFHSFMNKSEAKHISQRLFPKRPPVYQRDMQAIEMLGELLASPKPKFILLNKFGIHFPYYSKYPATSATFDTGPGGEPGPESEMKYLIGSYNNAILWSVDTFFKTLLDKSSLANTLVIYTSDHGQSLFAKGHKLTHCSKGKIEIGEGLVPLFATTGHQPLFQDFQNAASQAKDQLSHFQIYPTLLTLMGYEKQWVEQNYGRGLLSPPIHKQQFMSGDMFSRIRGSKWIEVTK